MFWDCLWDTWAPVHSNHCRCVVNLDQTMGAPKTDALGPWMKLRVTVFLSSVVVGIWWPVVDLRRSFPGELVNILSRGRLPQVMVTSFQDPAELVGVDSPRANRTTNHVPTSASTPHRAHFTHANIFSRVAQSVELAPARIFCLLESNLHHRSCFKRRHC